MHCPSVSSLADIVARLRDPQTGCPWDKTQTSASIVENTLEEAYEVRDAVDRDDAAALKEELGDLLLHVVFHAQIARENGDFTLEDVAKNACEKMMRRHPHIFGDESAPPDWEETKRAERIAKKQQGVLDGIATALPAPVRALKLQKRAATVGFDWDSAFEVLDKIEEEIGELRAEMRQKTHESETEDELGDVLFACVNLARKLNISPERALKRTNEKFERRFRFIEESLKSENKRFSDVSLDDMEALWCLAKRSERP